MKVGTFGIPVKNGEVVSLSIKMTKRDQESDCHRNVFAFSSPFCREDFLFIVMDLHSVNYFIKRNIFLEGEKDLKRNYEEETEVPIACAKAWTILKLVLNGA